jgi:hypothetical protein
LWGGVRGGGKPDARGGRSYRWRSAIPPSLALPRRVEDTPLAWRAKGAPSALGGGDCVESAGAVLSIVSQNAERNEDLCLDIIEVREDLVIPEAKNSIALRRQPAGTTRIGVQTLRQPVLCAIDLNDQFRRVIAEVRNIRTDGRLLPKLKTTPIEIAQGAPELLFGVALVAPHAYGPLAHQIGHGTHQLISG